MNIQKGNFFAITSSPISMGFLLVAVAVILFSVYNQGKINKREAAAKAAAKAQE
jgi:TctA family transporter